MSTRVKMNKAPGLLEQVPGQHPESVEEVRMPQQPTAAAAVREVRLHSTQLLAIATRGPRVAVLAAPGSGKTAVLTQRAERLLVNHHPKELLLVTFTNAAAAEMRDRVADLLPQRQQWKARKMQISTIHSVAVRLMRQYHDVLGMHECFSIYDERDEDDLYLYAGREMGVVPAPGAKKKRGQVTTARSLRKKQDVIDRVQKMLREAQAVTYDGMEQAFLGLLSRPKIAAQLRARWRHVLVDESQDLSDDQHKIFATLAPPNLYMVSDPSQRIYTFRGATGQSVELSNRPDWERIVMPVNWRSRPPIVAAATRVGREMAVPGLEQEAGRPPDDADRHAIAEIYGRERGETLAFIASDIQAAHGYPNEWRDMAALAPTWRQLEQLAETLEARGIPYRVAKRTPDVWASDAARWAVNCLRVVVNPHDHIALWLSLNAFSPRVSTGEMSRIKLAAMKGGTVLDCAVDIVGGAGRKLLAELVAARDMVTNCDDEVAADEICNALGHILEADLHLINKARDVARFGDAVDEWDAGRITEPGAGLFTVKMFLDAFSARELGPREPVDEEAPDEVTLATVHGAKGLQWPCVWVLGCETSGRRPWPGEKAAAEKGPGYEEALRLFYVAMTRAQDRLRLCWAESRERSVFVGFALGEAAERVEEPAAMTAGQVVQLVDSDVPF